ncbi:MAG: hypothetical protein ACRD5G_09455 [Candidatus Acidiferrales bacterium]
MSMKIAFLGAAAALALTVGAGTAQADRNRSRDACRRQINKAEDRLRDAIRNRGPYSERARERRAQLSRVRAQCGTFGWGRGRDRGRDDNWWGWGRDRDRDDRWRDRDRRDNVRWRRNRGRTDNIWNRGRDRDNARWRNSRGRNNDWFWSRDGRRHRHSSHGAWCNHRH